MKITKAKMLKAMKKLNEATEEFDKLEAEGELEIAQAEYRQKEIALENLKAKSMHVLRSIYDFWGEFKTNEQLCAKLGFSWEDWNKLEVEEHYWTTVNDRKVQKAATYTALGMSQQLGDSLPLQNHLETNLNRVDYVKKKTMEELTRQMSSKDQIPFNKETETPAQIEEVKNWLLKTGEGNNLCKYRGDNGSCNFRPGIPALCTFTFCKSISMCD